ncbi:MAG: M23 family metallopeptidase [Deltaproteobacteria bacterium]
MDGLRKFLKLIVTPITIMMVPHSRTKTLSIRVPFVGIALSVVMFLVGTAYIGAVSVRTIEYYNMRDRLSYVSTQFVELKTTMYSLKLAENEFRKLFALKSKTDVLEKADFSDTGSLDMEILRKQIGESMESVMDIKKYIADQKDLYLATPVGFPAPGRISSSYGYREHPKSGEEKFHSGLDVSVPLGTQVKATADGIVSFAGWTPGGGNTVVVEHGHGFSTAYAHNRKALVRIGQRVARGDAIALSGSTGISTGPHIHYEVWRDGRHVNPNTYLTRR